MKTTTPKGTVERFIKNFEQIQNCVENLYSSIDSILKLEEFSYIDAKIVVESIHRDPFAQLSELMGVGDGSSALIAKLSYSDKLNSDPQEFEINLMEKNINYEEEILKGIWQKS